MFSWSAVIPFIKPRKKSITIFGFRLNKSVTPASYVAINIHVYFSHARKLLWIPLIYLMCKKISYL